MMHVYIESFIQHIYCQEKYIVLILMYYCGRSIYLCKICLFSDSDSIIQQYSFNLLTDLIINVPVGKYICNEQSHYLTAELQQRVSYSVKKVTVFIHLLVGH